MVRVKSYKDILATMDVDNKNRGMAIDADLMSYCGGTVRVRSLVKNLTSEKTGKMTSLEGAPRQARYSNRRFFCPRGIYPWW
jgi:hypothetical protein